MPLLCIKCDSQVKPLLTKSGMFWCPGCDEEIERKDVYRVGKRFFQQEDKELRRERTRQKRKKLKGLKIKQRRIERRKHK